MREAMTGPWGDWEVIRRQVAVCGRVIADPDAIAAMDARIEGSQVVDTVTPRFDGIYFFLDLPSGHYTVTVSDARGEMFGEGRGHVDRNEAGDVTFARLDIKASVSAPPEQPGIRRRRKPR
jgi:hypothetical protein